MDDTYARERASGFLASLESLWTATDYPEWQDLALYSDEELKQILGEWEHVRKACDAMWKKIRASRPDLPGSDPIQGDRPLTLDL